VNFSASAAGFLTRSSGRVTEKYFDGMSHTDILAVMSVYFRKRRTMQQQIDRFIEG
jgi:hypothetical protein